MNHNNVLENCLGGLIQMISIGILIWLLCRSHFGFGLLQQGGI